MRSFVFHADPMDPKSKMFAWMWECKSEDFLVAAKALSDELIDHYFNYEPDGSVSLSVLISGDWVSVPYGYYLVLDHDRDLFVMSPDRFDEWFPPTSYGHGMVMTDGN